MATCAAWADRCEEPVFFEVVTTIALLIGVVAIDTSRAGEGLAIPATAADAAVANAAPMRWDTFLVNVFPETSPSRSPTIRFCRSRYLPFCLALRWRASRKKNARRCCAFSSHSRRRCSRSRIWRCISRPSAWARRLRTPSDTWASPCCCLWETCSPRAIWRSPCFSFSCSCRSRSCAHPFSASLAR